MLFKCWDKISAYGFNLHHHYSQFIGSKRISKIRWRKILLSWVTGWTVVSVWIFFHLSSQATEKRKETLARMCDERARMLQDQFNVSMNHIQALSIFISTFHHGKSPSAIDQKTFASHAERTAFERPLTSGVAYAVRVLHSEREQFEKHQGWTIKRMNTVEQNPVHKDDYNPNLLEPSPIQEEYVPVIFAQDILSHVISIDLLSGKEDRDNILRARKSGKGVLTAPFSLLKTNRLGVILTFAVYKRDLPSNATLNERIQATDGYLGGVFEVESLVEKLLQQFASKQTILVNVLDTTNQSYPISMYGSNTSDDGLEVVSHLNFGDPARKHEMRCRFKQEPPWPWLAITTSIDILVIALLVIRHTFYATVNRIAKVEDDCRKMSTVLKKQAEAADVAKSQFRPSLSLRNILLGRKILIVDDNNVNLKVAAGALKKYGADVVTASRGMKAIELLTPPHQFDVCFMDIQMPEMDGFEATRHIRDWEKNINDRIHSGELSVETCNNVSNWHVTILAMTADVIQATQEECQRCGMDGYVSKPLEAEQLYREISRFFQAEKKEQKRRKKVQETSKIKQKVQ